MLRLNQNLINLSKQEEVKKKQLEAIEKQRETEMLALKAIEEQKEAEKLANENWLKARMDNFKRQFVNLFARLTYKFTAELSENGEFIEMFTQGKELFAKYGKDASGVNFKPEEVLKPAVSKAEDVAYASQVQAIYNLMESTFK